MPRQDFGKMHSTGAKVLPDGHNKSLKKSQILYLTDPGRFFTDFALNSTRHRILWIILGSGPGFMKKYSKGAKGLPEVAKNCSKKPYFSFFEQETSNSQRK